MNIKALVAVSMLLLLAACSSAPQKSSGTAGVGKTVGSVAQGKGRSGSRPAHCPEGSPYAAAQEDLSTRGNYTAGGLYKPGVKDSTPTYVPDVACIPEPLVENLPRSVIGNKSPYEVLGKSYKVMDRTDNYVERGTASYYGAKFHGRLTSNREVYDMYQFSAAHKTLPIPSFARVTNTDTGESVIVRVNDRGPFHDGRVIDLSYAAAVRLGITQRGTGNVEVRALQPGDDNLLAAVPARSSTRAAARATAKAATPAPASAARTDMDALVARVAATPAAAVVASAKPATVVPAAATTASTATAPTRIAPPANAAEAWRYRVADSAKPGSADNFDRWMRDNNVRVATGKPATASPAAAPSATPRAASTTVASAKPVPAGAANTAATPPPATAAQEPSLSQQVLGSVLLQVASFASRDNATRAQGKLSAAGIVGASISDIAAGGRTLWRLRVPANDHASATELAGRIAGLGFGAPQIVKE